MTMTIRRSVGCLQTVLLLSCLVRFKGKTEAFTVKENNLLGKHRFYHHLETKRLLMGSSSYNNNNMLSLGRFCRNRHKLFGSSSSCDADNSPRIGSIVTIDLHLKPEQEDFIPEYLFDANGLATFVLGRGNYLPGIHDEILKDFQKVGDKVTNVSIDAGWGSKNPNLIAKIPKVDMEKTGIDVSQVKIGVQLMLSNGAKCTVTEISDDAYTIDANPPLAGASYLASIELKFITNDYDGIDEDVEFLDSGFKSKYETATFALGCFWGGELEYMRERGVVGTKVGFTQGHVNHPTYKDVCTGNTGHTEAIMITFDSSIVSYEQLVQLAMVRLGENRYLLNQVNNDIGTQYRHGIYYHTAEQCDIAERIVKSYGDDCVTEVKKATKFYVAEDYHQQYLLKGGQSARKGDDTIIRCYG